MAKGIEINVSEVCPGLVGKKVEPKGVSMFTSLLFILDPAAIMSGYATEECTFGGKRVEGEIVSDDYVCGVNKKVEVKCDGCELCPGGFVKNVCKRPETIKI
jgi:hypothetical protein